MKMKTKELTLEYEDNPVKFTIKRLTMEERGEIEQQAFPMRQFGNEMRIVPDRALAKQLTIVKGLLTAPFTINIQEVKKIDGVLGEMLYQEIEKMNELPTQKKTS